MPILPTKSNDVNLSFRSLMKATGGTESEVSHHFNVPVSDVKKWLSGEVQAPERVVDGLIVVYNRMLSYAKRTLHSVNDGSDKRDHVLKISTSTAQAMTKDYPFVGCEEIIAGIVMTKSNYPIRVHRDEKGSDGSHKSDYIFGQYRKRDKRPNQYLGDLVGFVKYKNKPALLLDCKAITDRSKDKEAISEHPIPCIIKPQLAAIINEKNTINKAWSGERIHVHGTLYYDDLGDPEYIEVDEIKNVKKNAI